MEKSFYYLVFCNELHPGSGVPLLNRLIVVRLLHQLEMTLAKQGQGITLSHSDFVSPGKAIMVAMLPEFDQDAYDASVGALPNGAPGTESLRQVVTVRSVTPRD